MLERRRQISNFFSADTVQVAVYSYVKLKIHTAEKMYVRHHLESTASTLTIQCTRLTFLLNSQAVMSHTVCVPTKRNVLEQSNNKHAAHMHYALCIIHYTLYITHLDART